MKTGSLYDHVVHELPRCVEGRVNTRTAAGVQTAILGDPSEILGVIWEQEKNTLVLSK